MVVNQGSVIPPFLSELPAKIHSTEVLPVFPPLLCTRKVKQKEAAALTRMRLQNSLKLHSETGLTVVWSSRVLPRASGWPSDQ